MSEITPVETERLLKMGEISIIDVREADEVVHGTIPQAIHIPLREVSTRLGELDKGTKYVIVCRSGNRSGIATQLLNTQGYDALNMVGGMIAWNGQVVSTK